MAKKTIATLQSSESKMTKVIRCVKKGKSGAYQFKSENIPTNKVEEYLQTVKEE